MFFNEAKTLIVVYRDEMIVNQLKKMVESKDDNVNGNVVGVTDGSLKIVPWGEKVWNEQKKVGNIGGKILFIGDVKGIKEGLAPIIDVKFNRYGVKYGWAGNQAVISIDESVFENVDYYDEFYEVICDMPVPEEMKKRFVLKHIGPTNFMDDTISFFKKMAKNIKKSVSFDDGLSRQMLFYGIINLYMNHLEEFINS